MADYHGAFGSCVEGLRERFGSEVLVPLDAYLAELKGVAEMRLEVERHRSALDHYTRKVHVSALL